MDRDRQNRRRTRYDVIVLGAGASGLMCAMTAAHRGRHVVVLDHNEDLGAKVAVSGGGRCNFTNRHLRQENYVSDNPRFCISAISRFRPEQIISFVERHGIPWEERAHGQLFLLRSAQDLVHSFRRDCEEVGVKFELDCRVTEVSKEEEFHVSTESGSFEAPVLVLATGGLSYPKLGATDLGYYVARWFGLDIVETRPGLVPFTWNAEDLERYKPLAGVTMDAQVSLGRRKFRENILFTHRGISGPAMLQLSNYWQPGQTVTIDLSPARPVFDYLQEKKKAGVKQETWRVLDGLLPGRLAQQICAANFWTGRLLQMKDTVLRGIAQELHRWQFSPDGTEGYPKAEVTVGGIDTRRFSPTTFECKDVPGLFAIGEALDVTGQLGGYNLHWAWASGHAAGEAV